jgi:hypothetical protein
MLRSTGETMMQQLLSIGTAVHCGSEEEGCQGVIEAVFIYHDFVQYVVTWWEEGAKRVENVEAREIKEQTYGHDDVTIDIFVKKNV